MRRGTLWWWWWCPAPPPGVKQVELSARSSCDQLPFREQKRVTTPAKHLLLYYSSPANRIMNRTCKICPSLVKIKKSLGTLGTLADLRQFYLRVECFLTAVLDIFDTISLVAAPGSVWSAALQGRVATWPELVGGKQTPPSHTGGQ